MPPCWTKLPQRIALPVACQTLPKENDLNSGRVHLGKVGTGAGLGFCFFFFTIVWEVYLPVIFCFLSERGDNATSFPV